MFLHLTYLKLKKIKLMFILLVEKLVSKFCFLIVDRSQASASRQAIHINEAAPTIIAVDLIQMSFNEREINQFDQENPYDSDESINPLLH